jgi:hypothetical protein
MVSKFSSEVLERRGKKALQPNEFLGYIGLELGMSLLKFNSLRSYWRSGAFMGHDTFKDAMMQQWHIRIHCGLVGRCWSTSLGDVVPLQFL